MSLKVISDPILYPDNKKIPGKKSDTYKPLDTYKNLEFLLNHFNAEIKYNLMTRKREVIIPGQFISKEDKDNDAFEVIYNICVLNDMPIKFLKGHLNTIALRNTYHPIIECIKSNPWDGVKRVDDFLLTIKSTNQELSNKLIRTWMVAAIAAAFSDEGFTNHGVIVIQGKQGIGKTEWIKKLDPINCHAIKDGAVLDVKQKDCLISLSRFWIVELGELDATYNSSDIARLKSFITTSFDTFRSHYAHFDQDRPRRTAYIATVNKSNYLVDDTGNRRWWTIEATEIDYQHKFDMKQIWAEIHHEWSNGALSYLSNNVQEEINEINNKHEQIDPLEEKFLSFFDWTNPATTFKTSTKILEEMRWHKIDTQTVNKLSRIITKITGKEAIRKHKQRLREVPAFYNTDVTTN